MKRLTRYRLSVLAATGVVAVGAWMLVGCSKQLAGNETGAPVEVALPALVIEPSQALFFGSAAENPDGAPTQETSPNNDLFSVQVIDPATTAAAETTPTKASNALSNVWVLQFDGGGTTRACVYVGTVNAESNILATLESGEGYSVWVVANGPGNGSFTTSNPATISDFESKLLYTGNTTSDSQIPLCGKIENVTVLKNGQLLVGNNNAVVPSVLLRRAQARVDMILEYDVSGAVFDGAWLYNVPTGACYGLLESAADGFPEAVSGNFSYTDGFADGAVHAQGTQNANSTYTWYMGDNRRGTKSDILYEIQKNQYNAPQYATYIRIKGHEEADETKYLFHDVYLGKTKTSDFNVLRNWSYTFRVRIGGTLAQQKALTVDDPRVSAGTIPNLTGSITPSLNTDIAQAGGTYTVTLNGSWSGGNIPVRAITQEQVLAQGEVAYSEAEKGGHTTLTLPSNETNIKRPVAFQYYRYGNWIVIASGEQKGKAIDMGLNFILQKEPNKQCTWQEAIDYCKTLGTGWRLPTSNELLLYWGIIPALTDDDEKFDPSRYYWGGREGATDGIISLHAGTGHINSQYLDGAFIKSSDRLYARCVQSIERDDTYPKIEMDNGYAVVTFVDEFGGLDSKALFETPQEKSPLGNDQSEYNRISRKFRIQQSAGTTATWDDAKNYCDNLTESGYDNWRLPTQREAMLLFAIGGNDNVILGDQSSTGDITSAPIVSQYLYQYAGFTPFTGAFTWASTVNSLTSGGTAGWYWLVCMGSEKTGEAGFNDPINKLSARCIRDEKESWPVIEE